MQIVKVDVIEMDKILKIEPVTMEQFNSLCNALQPIARMVSGIAEVDVSKGRGLLDENNRKHCLWTKSGHRVTVCISSDGGIVVSKSKDIDPDAPESA